MKNTFRILIALIAVTGLWSCEGEDNFMLAEPQQNAFALLTPDSGSRIILTEATAGNTAVTFTWEEVSYGTPTSVTYTLEMAANGTDFAEPVTVGSINSTTLTVTVGELNTIATDDLGLATDIEGAIDVRVVATIGSTGSEPVYSDAITILVTPFAPLVTERPQLYLVGPASEAGWSNSTGQPMFRDATNDNLFYLTAYFNAGELKFLEKRGQWAPQYGSGGTGTLIYRETESDPDPSPIMIGAAGYYTITVDTEALTYSIEMYDASAAPTFTSVGIIGTGTPDDWTSDQDMTNSAQNPHLWKVTGLELTAENVKFRANDSWDLPGNWGGGTVLSGQLSVNGGDFVPVEAAGAYDVYFNDLDGRYVFIPVP